MYIYIQVYTWIHNTEQLYACIIVIKRQEDILHVSVMFDIRQRTHAISPLTSYVAKGWALVAAG